MMTSKKHWVLVVAGAALFVSGVALGEAIDRYAEASATITKGQALLNAVGTQNKAEKKQRDKALANLDNAQKLIACAQLRAENPKAACE